MNACPAAEIFLESVSDLTVKTTGWTHSACSNSRPANDWETFSTSARATAGPPKPLPDWTQISISVNSVNTLATSTVTVTDVQYFPDRSPTDVDINSVEKTLATRAGVYNCPR